MHYVMYADWPPGTGSEQQDRVLARRAEWQYPKGLKPIVELWVAAGSPAVVFTFEADDPAPITELTAAWDDVLIVRVSPALTPEEGLRLGVQGLNNWHQQSPIYRGR
jgi:Domain of unknown function (DUF3303)